MSQIFKNNAKSTLSLAIGPADTSLPVVDTSSFPLITGTDYALVTLQYQNLYEVVKLKAPGIVSGTLIVDPAGRGQEGTTALSFPAGSRVECRITAGTLNLIVTTEVNDIAAESAARIAADSSEATTRAAADTTLGTAITNEITARSTAVSSEASTRAAADTSLQGQITAEVTAGTGARDVAISAAVAAEATVRSTAVSNEALTRLTNDNNLQAQISALSGGVIPELISSSSGTVVTRSHTGHVLIVYNGFAIQGGAAALGWTFYFNGLVVNTWVAGVNFQVAVNPSFWYYAVTSGAFTFSTTMVPGGSSQVQFSVYYV